MRLHLPQYYEQFECIADKCSDSCCRGWRNIEIDDITYAAYMQLNDEFSIKLKEQIKDINGQHFFKLEDGRCPFLNDENLCDIYINEGKDMLCGTCSSYPRFVYYDEQETYATMTLSCPEVADMIIGAVEPVRYYVYEDNKRKEEKFPDIDLIQEGIAPLWKKLALLALTPEDEKDYDSQFAGAVYETLDGIESNAQIRAEIISEYLTLFYRLTKNTESYEKVREIMEKNLTGADNSFEVRIDKISQVFDKYLKYIVDEDRADIIKEFENFICYGLFRSKSAGYEEEEHVASLFTIIIGTLSIFTLQAFLWENSGNIEYSERVDLFHCHSKVFEHSEKMREKTWEKFFNEGYMKPAVMVALLVP